MYALVLSSGRDFPVDPLGIRLVTMEPCENPGVNSIFLGRRLIEGCWHVNGPIASRTGKWVDRTVTDLNDLGGIYKSLLLEFRSLVH